MGRDEGWEWGRMRVGEWAGMKVGMDRLAHLTA